MTDQTGSDTPEEDSGTGLGSGQPGSYPQQPSYSQQPPPGQPSYPGQPSSPQQPPPGQPSYSQQPSYPQQPPPGQPSYPGAPAPYPGQGSPSGYPPPPPPYPGAAQPPTYGYAGQSGYPGVDPNAYPGAPGYAPGQTAPVRGWSGWAIAAFITALIPLVGILAAVPLGIIALVKISRTGARGRWLAIIGMVISGLWYVGLVAVGIWVQNNQAHRNDAGAITDAGTLEFGDVRTGDCVKIPGLLDDGSVGAFDIKGVPCASEHNAQALYVVTFPDTDYPGTAAISQQTATTCGPRYVAAGVSPADRYLLYPTETRWSQSDGHRAICFLTNGGQTMVGSSLN